MNKLSHILKEIESLSILHQSFQKVKLVAVSKTKSPEEIMDLYEQGQRDFGENYVDELIEKSQKLPNDINWHFIGHLQSNKIKMLSQIHNLRMIHSIDSIKQCQILNKEMNKLNRKIDVLVQVKLSEEETKSGVEPAQLRPVIDYILSECDRIRFEGLMTIGQSGDLSVFDRMKELQLEHQSLLKMKQFELSMGMSADYQTAIQRGATIVRIGSLLFGERKKKPEQ